MNTSMVPRVTGRVLVDTSALLALASLDDQYHATAVQRARRHMGSGGRFVGTVLILAELQARLLFRRGPREARRVLGDLLNDPAHEWVDAAVSLVQAAQNNWLERFADQRFTLADAVSFEVMRQERLTTAFAFDQDFVTAGFALLR